MRVGVDVGGTKTAAVLLDDTGAVVGQCELPTRTGADGVVATVVDAVHRVTPDQADITVGVGVPGQVDVATGRVDNAVNLEVRTVELGARLQAELGVTVRVDNDVKAAARGAHLHLGGGSLALVNVGTGLAVGLVLGGEVWRGSSGVAGEIGHLAVDPAGLPCPCGQRGCLETVASGAAVARRWPTDDPVPPRAVFDAAERGERAAAAVRDDLVRGIARTVQVCVLSWDVEQVVLAGGLTRLGAPLVAGVRQALLADAAGSPFLARLDLPGRVVVLPADYPAAAAGAALVADSGPARRAFPHGKSASTFSAHPTAPDPDDSRRPAWT